MLNLFGQGSLIAVLVMIGLEYSCFPVPSEFILPLAGFIARINNYNLFATIFLSILVSYFGCLMCYLVGYYGGSKLYDKIYEKKKKWRKGLEFAKEKFNKYGNISTFICRLVPLCRTYISFFAGIFKQSLFKYSFYSILGISLWNATLVTLGYVLVDKKDVISDYYRSYKLILIIIFIIVLLSFLVIKLNKNVKKRKNINGD